ncbi:hypothetical protein AB834_01570 [PVC group bacterium (ex Bugula neritina AB1)]|nr:hypothetical protein AB834_01570 [PVC group bacterium (ex Bugula neritina AB1)]
MKNNRQKIKRFNFNLKSTLQSSYQHSTNQTVKTFGTVFLVSNRSRVISKENAEVLFKKISQIFHFFGYTSQLLTDITPICRKSIGLRIGKGKGEPKFYAMQVKLGQPLFIVRLYDDLPIKSRLKINLYINRIFSLNIQ